VFYPSPRGQKTTKKKNTISLPGLPKKWVFIQLQLPNILCKPALTINGKKHPLFYLQLLCLAANFSKKPASTQPVRIYLFSTYDRLETALI